MSTIVGMRLAKSRKTPGLLLWRSSIRLLRGRNRSTRYPKLADAVMIRRSVTVLDNVVFERKSHMSAFIVAEVPR